MGNLWVNDDLSVEPVINPKTLDESWKNMEQRKIDGRVVKRMKVIYRKPRSGKTTELIKMSALCGGTIICQNNNFQRCIEEMASEMKLEIPKPITFDELLHKKKSLTGVKSVYIDNADKLLSQILNGKHIVGIAMDNVEGFGL